MLSARRARRAAVGEEAEMRQRAVSFRVPVES